MDRRWKSFWTLREVLGASLSKWHSMRREESFEWKKIVFKFLVLDDFSGIVQKILVIFSNVSRQGCQNCISPVKSTNVSINNSLQKLFQKSFQTWWSISGLPAMIFMHGCLNHLVPGALWGKKILREKIVLKSSLLSVQV